MINAMNTSEPLLLLSVFQTNISQIPKLKPILPPKQNKQHSWATALDQLHEALEQ
jgi:hypothetical protein